MIQWITENISTVIVLIILAVSVSAVFVKLRSDKKKGKSPCGCDCAGCAMREKCCGKSSNSVEQL